MQEIAYNPDSAVWIEPEPVKPHTRRMRLWRQRNRLKAHHQSVVANHRTQARRAGLKATLTFAQWWALLESTGWRCLACGEKTEKITLDLIKPHSRGGACVLSNVQPLCAWCNKSKGVRIIDYREKAA